MLNKSDRVAMTLRAARRASGISRKILAYEIGVSTASLVNWELRARRPKITHLFAWADALGFDIKLEKRIDAAPKSGQP